MPSRPAYFGRLLRLLRRKGRSHEDAEATSRELHDAGASAQPFAADFADPAATAALLPAVARELGRVDAVVNSASRFEYDSPEDFDAALLASLTRSNVAICSLRRSFTRAALRLGVALRCAGRASAATRRCARSRSRPR